jgi:hypothetical protein
VVNDESRASNLEYLVRHAPQIRVFALPIRYVAASSDFLQKEQCVESGPFSDESTLEKIRGAQCNRLTFEFGGGSFIRLPGAPVLYASTRLGIQYDVDPTAPVLASHVQTDDD